MNNMDLYNRVRVVPQEAQKSIAGGRLKGKTDINPMWRIAELTNNFGPCGLGWWYTIDRQWIESYDDKIAAFVNVTLYIKDYPNGIPGTGGSMFVEIESKGPYVSDECYKMALTDALSVACKALGFGADIYWQHGGKYGLEPSTPTQKPPAGKNPQDTPQDTPQDNRQDNPQQKAATAIPPKNAEIKPTPFVQPAEPTCEDCGQVIKDHKNSKGVIYTAEEIIKGSAAEYNHTLCYACTNKRYKARQAELRAQQAKK